jgi:hypothetical protein
VNTSHIPYRDIEKLAEIITADNARELLALVSCPHCWGIETLGVFHEPNNSGIGIVCRACGTKHPLSDRRIMWLPRGEKKQKRSYDIAAVIKERGNYCYGCGIDFEIMRCWGIGRHVHHTRPFAKHGEKYPKIPMCALVPRARQRHATPTAKVVGRIPSGS